VIFENIELQECQRVSSHFQAPAWIFTLQNLNQLEETSLPNLTAIKMGQLVSKTHIVSTESPKTISSQDIPLRFPLDDHRFDQIQSYYWVDRALQFAIEHFQLKVVEPIEVQTFTGFPQMTNAAFTFKNKIRVGRGDGVTYSYLAQDPSILIHEIGHALISQIAFLPTQGQGGSLNEAFADYFAATVLQTPEMGVKSFLKGPYKRTLNQKLSYQSISNKLYQDSLVVSSLLWEIETAIGQKKANKFFIESLIRLGPANQISEYAKIISELLKEQSPEVQLKLKPIFLSREWPINE